MTVSGVLSNCILQHLANLPDRSEVCARSQLFFQREESRCVGACMCALIFCECSE